MGNLKITEVNARMAEGVVTQEENDLDWAKVGTTTIPVQSVEYPLSSDSTNNTIYTSTEVGDNDLLAIKSDNNIVKLDSSIPKEIVSSTQILNVLGDGSCIACYPLDGNANDLSGNYNGTWKDANGNIVSGEYDTGVFGQAASFNESDSLELSDYPFTNNYDKTWSFWVYIDSAYDTTDKKAYLYGTNDGGWTTEGLEIVIKDDNLNMSYCDGSGDDPGTISTEYPKGRWFNVVFILLSDGTGKIYIDGELAATGTTKSGLTGNQVHPIIGGMYKNNNGTFYFKYLLDQVRIFNKVLTDDEIQTLYKEQLAKYDISSLNLINAPVKLFRDYKPPRFLISLGENENNFIPEMVERTIPICKESTNEELVTIDMFDGEDVIINDKDFVITDSIKTDNVDTTQTLDIIGDNSCIACYPLDGNANDLSGNYNGTWSGTEAYDTGRFGQAALSNDYSNELKADLNLVVSEYTISYWVYLYEYNSEGENAGALCIDDDNGDMEMQYFFSTSETSPSRGLMGNFFGTPVDTRGSTKNIPLNQWTHVVISVSRTNINIFRDGSLLENILYTPKNSTGILSTIGMFYGVLYSGDTRNTDHMKGLIDQVRIFNRALTDDEVQLLYKEQKVKYDISSLNLTDVPEIVIRKGYKILSLIDSTTTSVTIPDTEIFDIATGSKLLTDKGSIEVTNASIMDNTQTLDIIGDGSCIACYPLDGNANDLSGNYNGTWSGTEAYDTGRFGQAAKFDGNSYIDLSNKGIVDKLTDSDFTISLWGKPLNLDSRQEFISIDKDKFRITVETAIDNILINYNKHADYTYAVDDVDWENNFCLYTVVVDKTNSKGRFYLNGNLISEEDIEIDEFVDDVVYLGAETNVYDNTVFDTLEGLVDQVRIFNKALTDDEVQILYNRENKYYLEFNELSSEPSLLALPQKSQEQSFMDKIFDGEKFITVYDGTLKTGRVIQRKFIVPDNNIEIIPPIVTKLYKFNS